MPVKRIGLVVLIVLFAASSAQAAGGCDTGGGKLERVAARTPTAGANAASPDPAPSVLDNIPHLSKIEESMNSYLALHCEAVSQLLLAQAMRAHRGPACGAAKSGLQ